MAFGRRATGPRTAPVAAVPVVGPLAALDAAHLDGSRRASASPGALWAKGFEPPRLSARAALGEITQGCADVAAVDPLAPGAGAAILARLAPLAPPLRAVVALRVDSYATLHADREAQHLDGLADGLWYAGELLAAIEAAQDWEGLGAVARWARALGGVRAAAPQRAELGHVADVFSGWVAEAAFPSGLVLRDGDEAAAGGERALVEAALELVLAPAATMLRALALDLPAVAALAAGAARADGLRLIPSPSSGAAAMVVSSSPGLRELMLEVGSRATGAALSPSAIEPEARSAAGDVAAAYRAHPRGGHYVDPGPEVNDAEAMDRLQELTVQAGALAAASADGPCPELARLGAAAASCARTLRPPRGWGAWDEQAFALEALTQLCLRLAGAQAIARRDA